MLNYQGKLIGDFTVAKAADERFYIFGSGAAEEFHMRWWQSQLPADGSVAIRPLTTELTGLSIAGPKARSLLSRITDADVSNEAMPFMAFRKVDLGMAPVWRSRMTYTGDLGYEIWVRPSTSGTCSTSHLGAGGEFRHAACSASARSRIRLEKNFGTWVPRVPADLHAARGGHGPRNVARSRFVGRARPSRPRSPPAARSASWRCSRSRSNPRPPPT